MDSKKLLLPLAFTAGCGEMPTPLECAERADAVQSEDYADGLLSMAELTCGGTTEWAEDTLDPELCEAVQRSGNNLRMSFDIHPTGLLEDELGLVAEVNCSNGEPSRGQYAEALDLVSYGANALIVDSTLGTYCSSDDVIDAQVYMVNFDLSRPAQACKEVYGEWSVTSYPDGSSTVTFYDQGWPETRDFLQ